VEKLRWLRFAVPDLFAATSADAAGYALHGFPPSNVRFAPIASNICAAMH
jgi:hypothetical protein